ncbi:hypothetical protein D1872_311860 [compost metagenome]
MAANKMEKAASGIIRKNSQRQFKASRIKPDNVGPIAGPNMITRPMVPMAAPLFSGG